MCGEALKSKLLFRRDAHELHAKDAAEDIEIDDPKTGRKPRGICKTAGAYQERLKAYGMCQSMSRRGDPYDNAVAENFFSCLKCELIHLTHYPSRAKAQADVFAYIEGFYNTLRPHSALGWLPPDRFEADLKLSAA